MRRATGHHGSLPSLETSDHCYIVRASVETGLLTSRLVDAGNKHHGGFRARS